MRRKSRRDTTNVSLFPFLAVLLCTMGALIVLLIVIAQQARAQVTPPPEPDPRLGELRDQRQAERTRLRQQAAQLRAQVDAGAALVTRRRDALARLQGEVATAVQRTAELKKAERTLAGSAGRLGQAEQLQKQAADTDARIREVQAALHNKKRQAGGPQELFSIVPYVGRNGVARRPIYIECRADSLILLPEGTKLPASDFEFLSRGNPLEAAVRATVVHWERVLGPNAGRPYPLLLVRPDGVLSFYAARAALSTWGSDYGYELIDEDWSLALPRTDQALAVRQQRAIEAARRQMSRLARSQNLRRRSAPSFKVSRLGGLERTDGGFGEEGFGGAGTGDRGPGTGGRSQGAGVRGTQSSSGLAASGRPAGESTDPLGGGNGRSSSTEPGSVFSQGGDGRRRNPLGPSFGPAGNRGFGSESTGRFGPSQGGSPGGEGTQGGAAGGGGAGSASPGGSPGGGTGSAGQGTMSGGWGQQSPGGETGPGGTSTQSIAAQQGSNWALPSRPGRGSSPIRRDVRMIVDGDTVTVFADARASRTLTVIRINGDTAGSVDQLKDAVWRLMQGWGTAPPGFHWLPRVWAQVMPRGAGRFQDMSVLLKDSGFELLKLKGSGP